MSACLEHHNTKARTARAPHPRPPPAARAARSTVGGAAARATAASLPTAICRSPSQRAAAAASARRRPQRRCSASSTAPPARAAHRVSEPSEGAMPRRSAARARAGPSLDVQAATAPSTLCASPAQPPCASPAAFPLLRPLPSRCGPPRPPPGRHSKSVRALRIWAAVIMVHA
jgi:hypothetical protein